MITISIGYLGFSVIIGSFQVTLYVGDVYICIPKVISLAWNNMGLYVDSYIGKGGIDDE